MKPPLKCGALIGEFYLEPEQPQLAAAQGAGGDRTKAGWGGGFG